MRGEEVFTNYYTPAAGPIPTICDAPIGRINYSFSAADVGYFRLISPGSRDSLEEVP